MCGSTPGATVPSGLIIPDIDREEAPSSRAHTTSLLGTTAFRCGLVAVSARDSSSACFFAFSRCSSSRFRRPKVLESQGKERARRPLLALCFSGEAGGDLFIPGWGILGTLGEPVALRASGTCMTWSLLCVS